MDINLVTYPMRLFHRRTGRPRVFFGRDELELNIGDYIMPEAEKIPVAVTEPGFVAPVAPAAGEPKVKLKEVRK